ncbi:hypothetical protein NECAME_07463 [Necator americanus]|uniref:Uncharacterized protein n=1 Tax=Necator americanus TaxID=51031 RepID=W2TMF9_NECAM|nr:hypothetical protein NECAME_07463 [Necator americanus]ETN83275.1 hypothetical protein NECAME_07463 [Necator americanus]
MWKRRNKWTTEQERFGWVILMWILSTTLTATNLKTKCSKSYRYHRISQLTSLGMNGIQIRSPHTSSVSVLCSSIHRLHWSAVVIGRNPSNILFVLFFYFYLSTFQYKLDVGNYEHAI